MIEVYAVDTTEGLIETGVFVDASGIVSSNISLSIVISHLQWSGHISVKNLPHGRLQLASFPSIYQNLLTSRLSSASVSKDQPSDFSIHTYPLITVLLSCVRYGSKCSNPCGI